MSRARRSLACVIGVAFLAVATIVSAGDALLVVEQQRASLVQRIVADWSDALGMLPAERRLTPEQLKSALWQLRADRLLAASFAGSFSAIEALLADNGSGPPSATSRSAPKSLGDPSVDLTYTPVNPCRIVDTRNAGGPLVANVARPFVGASSNFSAQGGASGNCGMPSGVAAIAMNVYAVNPTNLGFIKVWPANGAEPAVSTVNYQTGITAIATGTIVPVDGANNNGFNAKSPAGVDLVADVVGYFGRFNGNIALAPSTAAAGNILKNGNRFLHNYGTFNTFVGENAGNFTMTGLSNTGVGVEALLNNAGGTYNTASGSQALRDNTVGSYNTAHGWSALSSNTTAFANTATGWGALANNTTGHDNTAEGAGALFDNTTGNFNTASGGGALSNNTTGSYMSAHGYGALANNTTGGYNTAIGYNALNANVDASQLTAAGYQALFSNTSGRANAAFGDFALYNNTTGVENFAGGSSALNSNTTGSYNTASGVAALASNTIGSENTASGRGALQFNIDGVQNVADGRWALYGNTTGGGNTASGYQALYSNTTSFGNVGVGYQALLNNTTGNYNIGIGLFAGRNLTTGDNNIDIANGGSAGESATIRIGNQGQHLRTFIAGIYGASTGGPAVPVLVDGSGQLATASSSRRYKEDIADMGESSASLMKLRPVTFHYRSDHASPGRTLQYGLIAEEVADVYPGLVARSATGAAETVLYQFLPPMLLNEFQKQQHTMIEQSRRIADLERRLDEVESLRSELSKLRQALADIRVDRGQRRAGTDAAQAFAARDLPRARDREDGDPQE